MDTKLINLLMVVIVAVLTIHRSEGKAVKSRDRYNRIDNSVLYDASDDVVILNSTNFKSTIEDGKTAWLVEFYLSWCGDCQRFAPTWKSLAKNIMGWKDIVRVAVINCANEHNIPFCRDYDINWYPAIRYFSIGGQGIGIDGQKSYLEEGVRHGLIEKLQEDQQMNKGGDWPSITPYRSSNPHDWQRTWTPTAHYQIFLFEDTDSFLGTELILDFYALKTLQIHRVTKDNQQFCMMHNVTSFPTLLAFDRQGNQNRLEIPEASRSSILRVMNDFLVSKNLQPNPLILTDSSPKPKNPTNLGGIDSADSPAEPPVEDVVYQADLEAALRISLQEEISRAKIIGGDKLVALKSYLAVLSRYFPQSRKNPQFFIKLYELLWDRSNITGSDFADLVAEQQRQISPGFAENTEFRGCRSSRAYTCGLWTLFHTLTVSHAQAFATERSGHRSVGAVLWSIHGYIKNFFSCGNCRDHFVEMAERRELWKVQTVDEAILWLWRAHNEVNERLAKEDAGDPRFPKIQYPSSRNCPQCRGSEGEWNEGEVLRYLKNKYDASRIRY